MAERRPPPQFSSTRSQQSDGLEAAELGGRLVALTPTKVMVFVDGTWLYYTLFERGKRCPIVKQFGAGWYENHYIDFGKIPEIISDHLSAELLRYAPNSQRAVEVVRVLVFSSFREEQEVSSQRQQMFRAMQKINFEVHLGSFTGPQEKCVDIALAVDMLHYATVPGAFDVAVLLSGDRDFLPALVRTRQKGKRVAICEDTMVRTLPEVRDVLRAAQKRCTCLGSSLRASQTRNSSCRANSTRRDGESGKDG